MIGAGRAGKVHLNSVVNFIPGGKVVAVVDAVMEH
jgi:hypothetical protein